MKRQQFIAPLYLFNCIEEYETSRLIDGVLISFDFVMTRVTDIDNLSFRYLVADISSVAVAVLAPGA